MRRSELRKTGKKTGDGRNGTGNCRGAGDSRAETGGPFRARDGDGRKNGRKAIQEEEMGKRKLETDAGNGYEAAIAEIRAGLKGDKEKDAAFLMEQMERYRDHPLAAEILRETGRMLAGYLPEASMERLEQLLEREGERMEEAMDRALDCVRREEYGEAREILEPMAKTAYEGVLYRDDSVSEYRYFDEPFEEILYENGKEGNRTLRPMHAEYHRVLATYGSLLIELGRIPEARKMLKRALHWNPCCFPAASEYIETFRITGEMDSFFDLTREAFRIAFKGTYVARCYRNLGYWFSEQRKFAEAAACCFVSLAYEPDAEQAEQELLYIRQETGEEPEPPEPEEFERICGEWDIPFGADDNVLFLADAYAEDSLRKGIPEAEEYFREILRDLTGEEEAREEDPETPEREFVFRDEMDGETDVLFKGSLQNGELFLRSEVHGEYDSEVRYSLDRDATARLFELLGTEEFERLCREEGPAGLLEFLDRNGIPCHSYQVW